MTQRGKPSPAMIDLIHTAAPWGFESYELHQVIGDHQNGEHGLFVYQRQGRLIARFPFSPAQLEFNRDTSGEQRANATLLVMAPEMLRFVMHEANAGNVEAEALLARMSEVRSVGRASS